MPEISATLEDIGISPIGKFDSVISDAKTRGIDIIETQIGNPDKPDKLNRLGLFIPLSHFGYEPSPGREELREIIAKEYKKSGIKYEIKRDNVWLTQGSSEAINFFYGVVGYGNKVIIPEPAYANTLALAYLNGVGVVPIPRTFDDGFKMPSPEAIEQLIQKNPSIKAMIVTNPSNPDGKILSRKDIQDLAEITRRYNLWLVFDSAYNNITFNGNYINPFEVDGIEEHLVEIGSLSKKFNQPGIRIGYIATLSEKFGREIMKPLSARLSVAGPSVEVALKCYEHIKEEDIQETLGIYQTRVEAVCEAMSRLCPLLEVDTEEMLRTDLSDKFFRANDNRSISYAFASGFYLQNSARKGFNEFRIAFVQPEERLIEGVKRLEQLINYQLNS